MDSIDEDDGLEEFAELVDPDGVYYPAEDEMGGETGLHYFVSRRLVDLLADFVRAMKVPGVVGGEQFFYYRRGDPRGVACPDAYLLLGETIDVRDIETWKLWDHAGKAPDLVVEVVSRTFRKDYKTRLIERYEEMGVRELIRYDPKPVHTRTYKRRYLTQLVRNKRGRLVMQPTSDVRLRSAVLPELWFAHHADDHLRIHVGVNGEVKWPTIAERAEAEVAEARAAAESATRAAAEAVARTALVEAGRAAAEAERMAAEAEVVRLRAELARLRGA